MIIRRKVTVEGQNVKWSCGKIRETDPPFWILTENGHFVGQIRPMLGTWFGYATQSLCDRDIIFCRPDEAEARKAMEQYASARVRQETASDPTVEQMVSELKIAGWKPKGPHVWEAPSGELFIGPYGAWKYMKYGRDVDAPAEGDRS